MCRVSTCSLDSFGCGRLSKFSLMSLKGHNIHALQHPKRQHGRAGLQKLRILGRSCLVWMAPTERSHGKSRVFGTCCKCLGVPQKRVIGIDQMQDDVAGKNLFKSIHHFSRCTQPDAVMAHTSSCLFQRNFCPRTSCLQAI